MYPFLMHSHVAFILIYFYVCLVIYFKKLAQDQGGVCVGLRGRHIMFSFRVAAPQAFPACGVYLATLNMLPRGYQNLLQDWVPVSVSWTPESIFLSSESLEML